jgi:hypothetical protein
MTVVTHYCDTSPCVLFSQENCIGGAGIRFAKFVGIGRKRNRWLGVTKLAAHPHHIKTGPNERRSMTMSKAMECHLRQACSRHGPTTHNRKIVRRDWRAIVIAEYPSVGLWLAHANLESKPLAGPGVPRAYPGQTSISQSVFMKSGRSSRHCCVTAGRLAATRPERGPTNPNSAWIAPFCRWNLRRSTLFSIKARSLSQD